MKKIYSKKLLSILIVTLLIFTSLVFASSESIEIVKVYFEDDDGHMVYVDYEEAINQSMQGNDTLYKAVKYYVGKAEEKGRAIYVETKDGVILDYKQAMIDNLFKLKDIIGNERYIVDHEIDYTHELKIVDGEARIVEISEEVYIVKIYDVEGIEVELGTTKEAAMEKLPETTKIEDNKGNIYRVKLNWSIENYDGNTEGTYIAIGTFKLPEGVENKNNLELKVRTTVKVVAPEPEPEPAYIVSIEPVEGIEVEFGTSLEAAIEQLPNTTNITDSKGNTHTVTLNWNIEGYDGGVAGVYDAVGTFELPEGIENKDDLELKVKTTVTVKEKVVEDFPEEVESVTVGASEITGNTYANVNIKKEYVEDIKSVLINGKEANQIKGSSFQWRIKVDDGTTVDDLKGKITVILVDEPETEPEIKATYHPTAAIPTFGRVSVEVDNLDEAVKFRVVYNLSDNEDKSENVEKTDLVPIGEQSGLIFYDSEQYKTVKIRIYNGDNKQIYEFKDVELSIDN